MRHLLVTPVVSTVRAGCEFLDPVFTHARTLGDDREQGKGFPHFDNRASHDLAEDCTGFRSYIRKSRQLS